MKDKINAIVGEGNVSDKETDLFVYKHDGSSLEGHPKIVVWPQTTEEVARVVKLANVRNIPVVARGGGTATAGGTLAEDAILLDLSRMNKIIRLHLTEQSITVQPAVSVVHINQLLASYNLFFPVVPHTTAGVSTLGGIVSRNVFSSQSFGCARDWMKSLEVVDGTGKVFSPSRVPLFVGSEGILGIITQLTLKLTKPPAIISGSWKKLSLLEELPSLLSDLRADKDVLGVEFFDQYCSQLLGLEDAPHLWIEYVFLDKGDIKDQAEIIAARQKIRHLFTLLKQNKFTLHTDPVVPAEGIVDFMKFCRKNTIPLYGHLCSGVFHACVRKEHPELAYKVYKMAQKLHGCPGGEYGVGRLWKEYLPEQMKNELKEHKKFYDPSGILNPGCLI